MAALIRRADDLCKGHRYWMGFCAACNELLATPPNQFQSTVRELSREADKVLEALTARLDADV